MDFPHPPATASIGRHPIHAMLAPFPVVCFSLTLLTDIAFWQTANIMWQNFSAWLLFAGLVFGALALLANLVDILFSVDFRQQPPAWPYTIGTIVVLLLALLNSFVHAGDGWTAVVPWGLALSAVTVLLLIATTWLDRSMVYRYGVGVSNDD